MVGGERAVGAVGAGVGSRMAAYQMVVGSRMSAYQGVVVAKPAAVRNHS